MELPLRCFDCPPDSCNSAERFYLFSCGHLACPLHVMSPTCAHDPAHFLVLDTNEDNFCKTQLQLQQKLRIDHSTSWDPLLTLVYDLMEGAVKCYLEWQAKMSRLQMQLPDVLPSHSQSPVCCSVYNMPMAGGLACTNCFAGYVQIETQEDWKCPTCSSVVHKRDCDQCQRKKRPLSDVETQTDPYDEPAKCRKCVQPLRKSEVVCLHCSEAEALAALPTPFCIKCGKEQDPYSIYCRACYSSDTEFATCRKCENVEVKANFLCENCARAQQFLCQDCQNRISRDQMKHWNWWMEHFKAANPSPMCEACHSVNPGSLIYCATCHAQALAQLAEVECKDCRYPVRRDRTTCEFCLQNLVELGVNSIVCQQCGQHPDDGSFQCEKCVTEKVAALEVVACSQCHSQIHRTQYRCSDCEKLRIETAERPVQTEKTTCAHCGAVLDTDKMQCRECYYQNFEASAPPLSCFVCKAERLEAPLCCKACFSAQLEEREEVQCSQCQKATERKEITCENCVKANKLAFASSFKCKKCFVLIRNDESYCPNCFKQECTSCGSAMEREELKCLKCQKGAEGMVQPICKYCGNRGTDELAQAQSPKTGKELSGSADRFRKPPDEAGRKAEVPGLGPPSSGKEPLNKRPKVSDYLQSAAPIEEEKSWRCSNCNTLNLPEKRACCLCNNKNQHLPRSSARANPNQGRSGSLVAQGPSRLGRDLTPKQSPPGNNPISSPQLKEEKWECNRCTFLNDQGKLSCSMCRSKKDNPADASVDRPVLEKSRATGCHQAKPEIPKRGVSRQARK